jgi:uncharacterized protein YndB with AHSA1/START domain
MSDGDHGTQPAGGPPTSTAPDHPQIHELSLTRIINAPPSAVYKACTDPALLTQWFSPSPYTTPAAEVDVRPGGVQRIVMKDPDGKEIPVGGVYLDVVPNERIVSTDAFREAWIPSERAFMTTILTFEKHGESSTKYTARVLHWSAADRKEHEDMGFHKGWGQCADQLIALVTKK